jgi:hypothetical protein
VEIKSDNNEIELKNVNNIVMKCIDHLSEREKLEEINRQVDRQYLNDAFNVIFGGKMNKIESHEDRVLKATKLENFNKK